MSIFVYFCLYFILAIMATNISLSNTNISKPTFLNGVDISTALEIPMDGENELKFQALRILQMKKIKHLMSTIDLKDKEIEKLKVSSKDSNRTKMIQALRTKVKELELIIDVLKDELTLKNKGTMTTEEVNDFIIKKTLAGPKRFRPLSREELENKIIEYEKKLLKGGGKISNDSGAKESKDYKNEIDDFDYTREEFEMDELNNKKSSQPDSDSKVTEGPSLSSSSPHSYSFLDCHLLIQEQVELRNQIHSKDLLINTLKDEVTRLRARNSELISAEEQLEQMENKEKSRKELIQILEKKNATLTHDLTKALDSLSVTQLQLRLGNEVNEKEITILKDLNNQLVEQNNILTASLTEAEDALDKIEQENSETVVMSATVESVSHQRHNRLKAAEEKNVKLEEKIKQLEAQNAELTKKNKEIPSLLDQLREKSIQLKELKRNLDERDHQLLLKLNSSANPTLRPSSATERNSNVLVPSLSAKSIGPDPSIESEPRTARSLRSEAKESQRRDSDASIGAK